MAMLLRVVSRATQPHLPSLADALRPLLAAANSGSFHLRHQDGKVYIEQNSFDGVDWPAVEAAVASAPGHTEQLAAKSDIDNWPRHIKALVRLIVKELNRLRQQPGTTFPAFTEAQVIAAIKAETDGL